MPSSPPGLLRRTPAAVAHALRQPALLVGLVICVGLWGFTKLASEVAQGDTRAFDHAILVALRVHDEPGRLRGPAWVGGAVRDVTALGGETLLTLFTVAVCCYLSLARRPDLSLFAAASVIGGAALMYLLKWLFARPRPDLVPHILTVVSSGSFPSGHAMLSAVVYLTLGGIVAEVVPRHALKVYVLSVAIFLTVLIGSTRVLLGVHYPTDVLAGWAAGFLWAFGCRTLVRLIRDRRNRTDV